jgi:nudix-type nucleoside diphosphatase (YffH/AdpP family)
MSERILSVKPVHKGWLDLHMVQVRLDDGETAEREVIDHPSGAVVLLFNPERRSALLITELRPPVEYAGERRFVEIVGGKLDEDDPEACARREAEEEVGFKIGPMEHVGRLWMTPATSTERVHFFLGEVNDEDRVGEGGGLEEEQEEVRLREIPLVELWRRLEQGELQDAKTFLLLQALRLRRPELF